MNSKVYKFIDLSNKRKVFACGDIHGCFDKLEEKLKEVGFDPETDALVSTGDLVDRGPKSHEAAEYAKRPWFYRVIGNHELMALRHIMGDSYLHTINGGGWLAALPREEQEAQVNTLINTSYLLEVKTPKGLHIGFVHADLPWSNWQDNIDNPDLETFVWSRKGVQNLRDKDYDPTVKGIDKVFFGHNALHKAYSRGNCNWIDTGCGFEDGELTIVDVETFGEILTI